MHENQDSRDCSSQGGLHTINVSKSPISCHNFTEGFMDGKRGKYMQMAITKTMIAMNLLLARFADIL